MIVPLYILAGGQSARFGADKAWADTGGGVPLLARVAEQWAAWVSRTIVVADRPAKYVGLGLRTIADRESGLGPMGGLWTAMEDCGQGWLLLAACDTLVLNAKIPQQLLDAFAEDVTVVALKGAQWETMPALYHCSLLPLVRQCLGRNERSLWRLIEQVPHKSIPYPPGSVPLMHINTQEDWRRLGSTPLPPG